jgi:HlyD family secretion protein
MSKGFKIIISFFFVSFIWVVLQANSNAKKKTAIQTTKLQKKTIVNNRFIKGIITPLKVVDLVPQISGVIEEIYVEVGQRVAIGDKIARIKLIASPEALEKARRNLEEATLNKELKNKEYLRNVKLFESKLIAKKEFEKIESEWVKSGDELRSAINQLHIVKTGTSNRELETSNIIRSTISGTILDIPLKIGATVTEQNNFNSGSIVATIADMSELIFKCEIPENDLYFLREQMIFQTKIPAFNNAPYDTKLLHIASQGKQENGIIKFEIEGKLITKQKSTIPLRTGYSGIAEIIVEKVEGVLATEEKNIIYKDNRAYVEVQDEKSKKIKKIEIGVSDGIFCEIRKGITKNENIIIQDR